MALFPKVQEKAQKEIDRVIGSKRMPTWSDRADLPYVRAVLEETLRCTLAKGTWQLAYMLNQFV